LQLQAASYLARSKAKLEHMMGSSRAQPAGAEAPAEQRLDRPCRRSSGMTSGSAGDAGAGLMMEQGDDSRPSSRQQQQQQLLGTSRQRGVMLGSGLRATSISSGGSDGQQQLMMREESLQLSDDYVQPQRGAAFRQRPSGLAAAGGVSRAASAHQQQGTGRGWSLDSLLHTEEADQQEALSSPLAMADPLEQEALDSLFGTSAPAWQQPAIGGAAEALEQQALDSLFRAPHQGSRGMPWADSTAADQDDCGLAARWQEPEPDSRKRPRHCSSINELFSEPAAGGMGASGECGGSGGGRGMRRRLGQEQRQSMQPGCSQEDEEGQQLDTAGGQLFGGAAAAASPVGMARAAAFRWQQSPGGTGTAQARRWGPAAGDDGAPGLGVAGGLLDRLTPLFKGSSWEVQHASATFTSSL
jgi:hypothetical protein